MGTYKASGIEPRKSYTGALNIRIAPDTHSHLAQLAQKFGTSINSIIKTAIADYTKHAI